MADIQHSHPHPIRQVPIIHVIHLFQSKFNIWHTDSSDFTRLELMGHPTLSNAKSWLIGETTTAAYFPLLGLYRNVVATACHLLHLEHRRLFIRVAILARWPYVEDLRQTLGIQTNDHVMSTRSPTQEKEPWM